MQSKMFKDRLSVLKEENVQNVKRGEKALAHALGLIHHLDPYQHAYCVPKDTCQ